MSHRYKAAAFPTDLNATNDTLVATRLDSLGDSSGRAIMR